jgi:hypothetical protein
MTTPPDSKPPVQLWRWILGALTFPFIYTLPAVLITKLISGKTFGDLTGPYLAFVAPQVVVMMLIGCIHKWQERGASHRSLSIAWALSMAIFGGGVGAGFLYSLKKFDMILSEDLGNWIFAWGATTLTALVSGYYFKLRQLSGKPLIEF